MQSAAGVSLQSSACIADGQCQVSSSPARNGGVIMGSSSKLAVVADATASAAPPASSALQGAGPQCLRHSMRSLNGDKQHSSSHQWAKEIIQVTPCRLHNLSRYQAGRPLTLRGPLALRCCLADSLKLLLQHCRSCRPCC